MKTLNNEDCVNQCTSLKEHMQTICHQPDALGFSQFPCGFFQNLYKKCLVSCADQVQQGRSNPLANKKRS